MMKAKPVSARIAELEMELQKDIARWKEIRAVGSNDPFWPDGVNLNLVRNHIIFDLREIAKLEQSERQLSMFDAGSVIGDNVMRDKRIPPMVDDYFMVCDKYENGRRIKCSTSTTST